MQGSRIHGIARLSVEEGFLDGLNLPFDPALNVIIGARGSGKTSIIELIRYCLDVTPIVERPVSVASRQAIQVLGQGRVSVTLSQADAEIVVSRQGAEPPRGHDGVFLPLIVGTSEIERIGVEPSGRMALIDSFLDESIRSTVPVDLTTDITSQIEALEELRKEDESISASLAAEQGVSQALEALVAQQKELQAKAPELDSDRIALQTLASKQSSLAEEKQELERLQDFVRRDGELLRNVIAIPLVETPLPRFKPVVEALRMVKATTETLLRTLQQTYRELQTDRSAIDEATSEVLLAARPLRQKLNEHVGGLGTISTQVDQLRQQQRSFAAAHARLAELRKQIGRVRNDLDSSLDQLDRAAAARFAQRKKIIDELNAQLGQRIRIRIERSGAFGPYEAELASLIRGSGVHRTTLALLATRLSPRELYNYVARSDVDGLCQAGDIPKDRGQRVMEGLRASEYSRLLFIDVEDEVTFWLHVGTDYQITDNLSTGQRCTTVLPIILAQPRATLIFDQPEDHLDNAFIVETLVEGIRRRKLSGQVIIASHNANVPVLGEAELVILMNSDGQHAYIELMDRLDAPPVVAAIVAVLEGGEDAFRRRAEFYRDHAADRA